MKTGKSFSIFGLRGSLLGDTVMTLPVLHLLRREHPDCYIYWQIARQHAHAAPLYFNHPNIDQIVISDCEEGMGPRDYEIASKCDIVFNVMPPCVDPYDWPMRRNIYEQAWVMQGLPLEAYYSLTPEQRRPSLTKWFNVVKQPKTIAIWPCAGYGRENKRNPSQAWYNRLVAKLVAAGYQVNQYGHPRDFTLSQTTDCRAMGFFDQVKATVGCDLVISTDSGSGLIFGAYGMAQISLLTPHFPGHTKNLEAFGPDNPNNRNFVGVGSADNIDIDQVVECALSKLTK